jgi:hypothetical protein
MPPLAEPGATMRCIPASLLLYAVLLLGCSKPDGGSAPGVSAASGKPVSKPTGPARGNDTVPAAASPLAVTEVDPSTLAGQVEFQGAALVARRWRDRLGDNLLVLSRVPVSSLCDSVGFCLATQEIYGYHYLMDGGHALLWRTRDLVQECDVDLSVKVHPGAVAVSDLDADGIAETTFMYLMACRSDPIPAALKLIMHEGATKYAIRGTTDLTEYPGTPPSEMNIDPAFDAAPPAVQQFAVAHWMRFRREADWPPDPE